MSKRKRIEISDSEEEKDEIKSTESVVSMEMCEEDEDYDDRYENCTRQTRQQLSQLRKFIHKNEPTIESILALKISAEKKSELFQLFEIYNRYIDEQSLEKMELRRQLLQKIEEAKEPKYNEKSEGNEMRKTIENLQTNTRNKEIILCEYQRLQAMGPTSEEYYRLRTWINWAISLPYDKGNVDVKMLTERYITNTLKTFRKKLDEELYGMKRAKEALLVYLNARLRNPNLRDCSLGLVGPPGCAKTTIVRLLKETLNYPLEQISLGGIHSADFLKGHQHVWLSSEPGEIVKCLRRMGCKDGILFFDEYDTVSENPELRSALLHITDNTQNNTFQDNFLNSLILDLSHLWFIYSMNQKPNHAALADRIFYIEIDPPTQKEKFYIVKNCLLPKAIESMGFAKNSIIMTDNAIEKLVEMVSPVNVLGARALKHALNILCYRISYLLTKEKTEKTSFDISTKKISLPVILNENMVEKLIL